MTGPRRAAYSCVEAADEGAYANLAMPTILERARLRGRDAAFATELAFGTIRMRGWYDAVIAAAARRDVGAIEPEVLRCLRLGTHQVLSMDVSDHAAVDETVKLVREVGFERATGFANAVMRAIVRRDPERWKDDLAPGDALEAIALRTSHPIWVARELAAALDADGRGAELERCLAASNEPAPVTLVARPGLVERDALVEAIPGSSPTPLSPCGVLLAGGRPSDVDEVREGRAGVQDEGSQLAALALAEAVRADGDAKAGERWLDACAGPGGKTSLLGAIAARRGATLDAVEIHPHRADLVRESTRALPAGTVSVHRADATAWTGGPYDRILLDAPCTGLGALRRRPEARWRRTPADLDDLAGLQRRLGIACLNNLAPGGILAFVTCSPALAETREAVSDIVDAAATVGVDVERIDARRALARATGRAVEEWGRGPDVQLWTHVHGTDAMYITLVARGSERSPGG